MDNNQSSYSSDSEFSKKNKAIMNLKYPNPPKENAISSIEKYENVKVITNLLNITTKENINLILAKIKLDNNEQSLLNEDIKKRIKNELLNKNSYSIKKILFFQNYLFAIINSDFIFPSNIYIQSNNNSKISINLENIKKFQYKNFSSYENNTSTKNIGNITEIIIKDILLKNKNIIKFGKKSLLEFENNNHNKNNFCSYYISSQITSNGLYMLINSKEKIISKSVYMKISEIKKLYKEKMQQKEKINEYFLMHKNVLTLYGTRKVYTISKINFDKSPSNTIINITKSIN